MAKKAAILFFSVPEGLAQEIFDQALALTARLEEILRERGESPDSEFLQEALIHLGQSLFLGLSETLERHLSDQEVHSFVNEVFLTLGRLILTEFIQREPSDEEWEYFLTYFRSHFELLRRDVRELEGEFGSEEISLGPEAEDLLAEARKRIESLLDRFLA